MKALDLLGRKFGSLVVLRRVSSTRVPRWMVRCACSREFEIDARHLRNSGVESCRSCSRMTHGQAGRRTPTYRSWANMISRCGDPSNSAARNYIDRGIVVCDRWRSFENFLSDMGERPHGMSLDRFPDNNSGYRPGNCRWATQSQQMRNTRVTRLTEETAREALGRLSKGESVGAVAGHFSVSYGCIYHLRLGLTWANLERT